MTLWSNQERIRHFLLPSDVELPPGDFVLRSHTGQQRQVHEEAVAPYEVSREQATAWVRGQFGQALEQAKASLLEALRPLQEPRARREPRRTAARGQPTPREETASSSGLRLLEALSGEPLERLASDPEALLRGLGHVAGELGGIVDDAIAADPKRLEAARERAKALRLILNAHGVPVSAGADALPDRLHRLFRTALQEHAPERAAAALEALAQGLEDAAAEAAKRMRALAAELVTRARAAGGSNHSGISGAGQDPDEA